MLYFVFIELYPSVDMFICMLVYPTGPFFHEKGALLGFCKLKKSQVHVVP